MSIERKFWKLTRWARAARFWLFALLALVGWLVAGIGEAQAQTVVGREAALAACEASGAAFVAASPSLRREPPGGFCTAVEASKAYDCQAEFLNQGQWRTGNCPTRWHYWTLECPGGGEWFDDLKACETECSAREPLTRVASRGAFNVCSSGCQFTQGAGVCLGTGADMYCYADSYEPTGNQCQAGDPPPEPHDPNKDTCRSTGGGWSECVKPGGDHCVTGAKGTRMCWSPGETGAKNDATGKEWADRKPPGETPTPPPNITDPVEETNTGNSGGVSGDAIGGSFVVGGGSGSGNKGGQNNTGRGGSGSGSGSGDGDGDGDEDGPGGVGGGLGDFYDGTDKTLASVFGEFQTRAMNSQLMSVGVGVFGGCSGGGACPAVSWSASDWGISADLTMMCEGVLASLIAFAGWVALAGMAFFAWKVAFL